MRKNFIFFLVFLSLLIVTYGYEKIVISDGAYKRELEQKLFDVSSYGELNAIRTQTYTLLKQGDHFLVQGQNFPADPLIMRKVFNLIGNIKSVSVLSSQEVEKKYDEFFPNQNRSLVFKFERGELDCLIGAKILYSRSFYLKLIKEGKTIYLVAKVDLPLEGVHSQEEEQRSSAHYDQLISMITGKPELFLDRKILNFKMNTIREVTFLEDGINLQVKSKKMLPTPLKGIEVSGDEIEKFLSQLDRIYGREVFPHPKNSQLESKLRSIRIETESRAYSLVLFRKYQKRVGWFLYNSESKVLYSVARDVSRLFFQRPQNFWDRRLIHQLPKSFNISFKNYSFNFIYERVWKLKDKQGREVRQERVTALLKQLMLPADQINQDISRLKVDLYKQIFRFTILDREIRLMESKGDLAAWDVKNKIVYHYWVGQQLPFDASLMNYLY